MPFYEYQCSNCGHTLEAMQKITEAPLKKCPHCGKPQLQKLMSAPVFRLKGGGWYETDFKSDQDSKRNLADRPDSDAPKDDKKDKDKAEASSKEAPASSDAVKPEKSADKSSDKAADSGSKAAPAPGASASTTPSRRAAGSSSNKPTARKAVKRPTRPAVKKRPAAKPARRR
jgi:putative FmdB family regulatory protein